MIFNIFKPRKSIAREEFERELELRKGISKKIKRYKDGNFVTYAPDYAVSEINIKDISSKLRQKFERIAMGDRVVLNFKPILVPSQDLKTF